MKSDNKQKEYFPGIGEIKFEGKDQLYDKEGKQDVHVLNVIFYY